LFQQYQKEYYASGPEGGVERKQFRADNPEKAAILNRGWDYKESPALAAQIAQGQPDTSGLNTRPLGAGTYAPGPGFTATPGPVGTTAKPALPAPTTTPVPAAAAGKPGTPAISQTAPGYTADEAIKRFGEGVFGLDAQYSLLSSEQKKQWRAVQGEQWTLLARYREYKYGVADEEDAAYGVLPGYSVETALSRFGGNILAIEAQYGVLDTAARTAWRAANAESYKKLTAFWDYKYGPQAKPTSTGYAATSYGGYGGGGGGGRGYAPAVAAVPPPPAPTAEQQVGAWTPEQYQSQLSLARGDDPAFAQLTTATFGGDVMGLASQWYGMSGTQRLAWQQANPAAYAKLLRYLLWLAQRTKAVGATRAVQSIPNYAPIVPPSVPMRAPVVAPAPIPPG
jgi:hypothetical protein